MRIIFMGTPAFALPAMEALIASPHQVIAVYTQPPKPAGRGMALKKSPVHLLAEKHGIPVQASATLKTAEAQETFRSYKADVVVVAAYGLLLPKPILEACPHGCINIHPSLLPRWRGASPIQRCILAGDAETGVAIMQMNERLDAGDILRMEKIALPEKINAGELHDLLAEKGARLLLRTLDSIGALRPVPQEEGKATYAVKLRKDEERIDWNQPAERVHCHIRAFTPWPGAYFVHNNTRIRITQVGYSLKESGHTTGEVLDERLSISCLTGIIYPLYLQREGKKEMAMEAFLRGYEIPVGTVLE